MVKNLRSLLFGLGGGGDGGGGEPEVVFPGGGGVRGTFCGGIVEAEGVDGVGDAAFEFNEVATGPGGGGSFVLALAEPGRTTGVESAMLGLSA